MRTSLRIAIVLFFLGIVAMATLMGGDTATRLAVGGPGDDVELFSGTVPDATAVAADAPGAVSEDAEAEPVVAAQAAAVAAEDGQQAAAAAEPSQQAAAETETAAPAETRPHVLTHIVQRGETLWEIALQYGIDVDTIVAANDIPDINRLRVGQELTILTVRGALHTVRRGESLWDISRTYGVSIEEIATVNGIGDPSRIQVNQQLIIPGAQATAAALRREQLVSSTGQLMRNFEWPTVSGARISSNYGQRWGRMHYGIDIAVNIGTPVYAAAAGTVTYAGSMGTYGIIVIIDHGNGVETRYAHLSRTAVSVGQRVQRGQVVAYSGNTGNSTGPHLHFEIRYRGTAVDPLQYVKR